MNQYRDSEFFSGAQSRVYFGSILVDDITSIEWRGSSTKRPVYGYASEQFDAIARGQYIVQGAFMVPFKEVGYLHSVMAAANKGKEVLSSILADKGFGNANPQFTSMKSSAIPPEQSLGMRVNTTTKNNNTGGQDAAFNVTSLTAEQVLSEAAKEGGKSFQKLTTEFENAIWDRNKTAQDRLHRPDEFDTFDGPNGIKFIENGFNILITFGDVNNTKAPSTIKTIIDVHITSDERIVDSTGQPIYERYSFFARGADESVGSYSFSPGYTSRKGPGSKEVPVVESQDDGTTEAYTEPNVINNSSGFDVGGFRNRNRQSSVISSEGAVPGFPIVTSATGDGNNLSFNTGYKEIARFLISISKSVDPVVQSREFFLENSKLSPLLEKYSSWTDDKTLLSKFIFPDNYIPYTSREVGTASLFTIQAQATIPNMSIFYLVEDQYNNTGWIVWSDSTWILKE